MAESYLLFMSKKNSTGSTFGHVIQILATSCETMLHLLSSIN